MAKVLLENVSKTFGKQQAVKDLTLEVDEGEFACLLGPSGCGKTTTLRIIAGLEKPDTGDIYIGDTRVNDIHPADRDVAMVFQFYAIYPGMSVYDNLAFPLKQRKVHKEEIREKVRETAEILQIDHLLEADAMSLTAGEKQRVALGRAMVRNPRVFLLDEPLTNLDARLRATMRVELKKLQKSLGTTTIYVTHDQLEAMTMADKIAVMNIGVLQQYDTPDILYNHPKSLFVAGFVGSPTMNLVDCSFIEEDGKATLDFGDFNIDVTEFKENIKAQASGQELVFGVRPSDISVYRESGGEERLSAEVYVVEPIGDKVIIDLKLGDHLLKALAPRSFRANSGEQLWMSLDRRRIHIFDKKSGLAII